MSSLVLAMMLAAWPPARDAGVDALAEPSSWPAEPGWLDEWALLSFSPPGWALAPGEASAGVGMRVDAAWSVTRGDPSVSIAVIAPGHLLSDPLVAGAWQLRAGELPDAGDVNGNGRLDVLDFAGDPRARDVNANGALDLEDVLTSFSDGEDEDGDGRVDDLSGWDFTRDAGLLSSAAAPADRTRWLAAPVNDGLEGVGACPACTVLPLVASMNELAPAVRFAVAAGARVVLLPQLQDELPEDARAAMADAAATTVFITPGSEGLVTFPLASHPAVTSPRTLTRDAARSTATSRAGCGGAALAGGPSVTTTSCGEEAAARLAGIAGLVFSARRGLSASQVVGLLGGPRVDAARAVALAATELDVPAAPLERLRPSLGAPLASGAERCAVERAGGEAPFACDAGVPAAPGPLRSLDEEPAAQWVRVIERSGPFEFSTALPAPPQALTRGLISATPLGAGSGSPRFVDLDGRGSETVLAVTPDGLAAARTSALERIGAPLGHGRLPPAIGDLDGDRFLDVVFASDDGWLRATTFATRPLAGFPRPLEAPLAGPPLLVPSFEGTALVTVDVRGRLWHRTAQREWTFELGAAQVSAPAAGDLDRDGWADLAIANGAELRVLRCDARGPTAASWSAPSRATQALLGNLGGDEQLEIVADRVYDAAGRPVVELDGWTPSVTPPALARLDTGGTRSVVQVEARSDGRFELARYAVERALRSGGDRAPREVLLTLAHPPARGGFAVADVSGDGLPDVVLPTEDGLIFIADARGNSPAESPLPALGTVLSAPAIGVADDQLHYAVRTTRGDLVRWLGRGLPESISWEGAAHDRANTWNAETPLPARRLAGLGITQPPRLEKPCGCGATEGLGALGLLFLFRRRRQSC